MVLVFKFTDSNGADQYCGILHFGIQAQSQAGSNTQVSQILQLTAQQRIQVSNDPGTWIEVIKDGSRNSGGQTPQITIVDDDTINISYTTQTAVGYQLQQLYSITG